MPGENFTKEPKEVLHARSSIHSHSQLATQREQGLQRSTGEGRGHSLTNVCQLGFPNIGNTCFMNATLQCLLSLTCFWTPIIAQQASWMDTASSQMLRCLAELQQARLSSSKKQKKQLLRALKSCLSARCPAFDGYDQEDAHEFLMLILLQLKEEGEALRTSCVSSICPVEHFEFQLKSVRTCTSCGLQVSRVEDFNHLSLNLRSTLAHSLHAYFQECPPTGLYRLHGVVSHLGNSLDSGHYISDVAEGEGDSWLTFNDSEVSHMNESAVLKRRAKTAYLLFYVRSGAEENNPPFWNWDHRAVTPCP
ncbi:hypothetical protein SRHO_G00345110 [Serrasalmus rhombeus]